MDAASLFFVLGAPTNWITFTVDPHPQMRNLCYYIRGSPCASPAPKYPSASWSPTHTDECMCDMQSYYYDHQAERNRVREDESAIGEFGWAETGDQDFYVLQ